MDRLIPAFNKLQDIAASLSIPEGIELPQIVVVGAQSSGKSSVLESLVRKDFLPRGSGIVTRRPLVLRLCHLSEERPACGVFSHAPDRFIYDFDDIRKEIEIVTDAVAKDKDISPEPIYLSVYSHEVLDITLVDLPGITKVPVGGQSKDIERIVRDMIVSFIKNPNSLILAISSANTDLANSDALKLARDVDPGGDRTLGVLTKLDLMDKGTNAIDMLMNRVYPLRLGYIGMICRSQQDIIDRVSINTHLDTERQYFAQHAEYSRLAARMGAEFLSVRLNQLLIQHLRQKMPDLKKKVGDQLAARQKELQGYGYFDESQEGKSTILIQAIQKYCQEYTSFLDGKFFGKEQVELKGGAFINQLFFVDYRKLLNDLSPFSGLSDPEIKSMLANSGGLRPSFFMSSKTFELVMKGQIEQFCAPTIWCLDSVYSTLGKILQEDIRVAELDRFSLLKFELLKVVEKTLISCYESCRRILETFLDIEMSYSNVQHPHFIGCGAAVVAIQAEMNPPPDPKSKPQRPAARSQGFEDISSQDQLAYGPFNPESELKIIKRLMQSYFDIVRINIGDFVPKTIVHLLVNESIRVMERELIASLFQPSRFDELLIESEDIAVKRAKCVEDLKALHQLNEVLSKINFSE